MILEMYVTKPITLSTDYSHLHRARKEQERLMKNKERRKKREKQKKLQAKITGVSLPGVDEGSPEPSTEKVTGTTRKCANCGQIGHIKTNKKYCSNPLIPLFTDPSTWNTLAFDKWLG